MTMMLLALFAATGFGLLVKDRFGRRESTICVGIAAALTLIYFFRPMTMT
jgi:hypothetical protein